jgi:mannosyltransferase OCH1-like enzyme
MSNWINQQHKPLIEREDFEPNHIFFLYGFLGDDFQITQEEFIRNLRQWRRMNPDRPIHILRDQYDGIHQWVQKNFEWFYQDYQNYPKSIQRCDIIRYMLMYHYGGVYSDLDVECRLPIGKLFRQYEWANVIFGISRVKSQQKCNLAAKYETIRNGEPEIDILKLAKKRASSRLQSQYGIIYTTGPDVITTALSRNRQKYKDIAVIPIEKFTKLYPHSCSSSWRSNSRLPICEFAVDTI